MRNAGGNDMIARLASALVASILAIGILFAPAGTPAIAGSFSNMAGDWSGSGKVVHGNGTAERLRCRASYSIGGNGESVNFSIRCASDSFKIDLSGYMASNNGVLSGRWSEPNYNSAGDLTGRVSGNQITAHGIGNTFSARLSMSTGANQQSVTLRPEATDIRQVSLSFSRR
jgi:hypothetical protein